MPPSPRADPGNLEELRGRFSIALRLALLGRSIQALLLALSIGLVLLATAAWTGEFSTGAQVGAGLAACAASAAVWLERPLTPHGLASRIDRRLALGGELSTALECARTAHPPLLSGLLAARVAARTPRSALMRAGMPSALPFLALGMFTLALFALAREHDRPAGSSARLARLGDELEQELGRAEALARRADPASRLSEEELARLGSARARARAVAAALERGEAEPDEVSRAAEEIAAVLDDLREDLDPRGETARALSRARGTVEAARLGSRPSALEALHPPLSALDGAGSTDSGRAADNDLRATTGGGAPAGAGTVPEAGAGESGADGLENGTDRETMTGAPPVDEDIPTEAFDALDTPSTEAGPAGVALGGSWGPRHAPIVERWIEERRRARLGQDPHPDPASERE